MAKVIVTKDKLDGLAEAVGSKSGQGVPLTIDGMRDAVLGIETGIQPSGTLSISKNGTHDVAKYASANVDVTPRLQDVTVTPDEQQVIVTPGTGYDGLSSVTVSAIDVVSSTVIPGKAAYTYPCAADSPSLTVENLEVVVPAGQTEATATTQVSNALSTGYWLYTFSYTLHNGQTNLDYRYRDSSYVSTNYRQLLAGDSISGHPGVSFKVEYALTSGILTLYLRVTYTSSTTVDRHFTLHKLCCQLLHTDLYTSLIAVEPIPSQYIVPTGTKSITANGTGIDVAAYASVDVAVPTDGTPSLQSKTVAPTEQQQTISPDNGYDGLSSVTVEAISSTYVGSGIDRRTAYDVTEIDDRDGHGVIIPSGYYYSAAIAYVDAGTEGTPTATKGSVSNHAVTVTPSVTNSAGYIAGGTHSGTAVTVSASELVSGSQTITDNGTTDVTNLASVTVALDFVTYHTSTSAPTSSQGNNGDIWLVTS